MSNPLYCMPKTNIKSKLKKDINVNMRCVFLYRNAFRNLQNYKSWCSGES